MSKIEVDTRRLPLLLHELRLPAIARLWPEFAERADKESWPAARFLSALAELEMAERGRRRIARQRGQVANRPIDLFVNGIEATGQGEQARRDQRTRQSG